MDNTALITQCFKLLDDSTLSEERKTYWFNKISSGDFSDEDVKILDSELAVEIEKMNAAVEITEIEIARLKEKKMAAEEKILPVLQTIAEEAPKYFEEARADYKKNVLQAESEMMTKLEEHRGHRQNAEIDAIKKKLSAKK